MEEMRIGVVVPLFLKAESTRKLINYLNVEMKISKNDIIVVENNGSTTDISCFDSDVHIIRLLEPVGSAGVFGEGLAYLKRNQYDWAWLMDDDALPAIDALEKLKSRVSNLVDVQHINNLGAICSVMIDPKTQCECWNFKTLHKFEVRNTYERVLLSPYTGMLVNLKILEDKLMPSRKVFFWVDDTEFCLRIGKLGYSIFRDLSSIIYHPSPAKKKYLLGRYRLVAPPNRIYFYVRNTLAVYYAYDSKVVYLFKRIPSVLVQNFVSIIQDGNSKERLQESIRAYIDVFSLILSVKRSGW